MAITLLTAREITLMRRAGAAAAATLEVVGRRIRPGVSTADIDRWVRQDTQLRGGRPSQLGYRMLGAQSAFPAAVCTSVNHVVCHGIPSSRCVLEEGDIVNVDVTTELDGFHGDTSRTFTVGTPTPEGAFISEIAERCLFAGLAEVRPGARLGDIGAAISELAEVSGCSVVREFGGHGIGRRMHAEPHVPHHGERGRGLRLRAGMAFTIEPMINLGAPEIEVLSDGWTVVTQDGKLSAQFEHTVLVTEAGFEVMTASTC